MEASNGSETTSQLGGRGTAILRGLVTILIIFAAGWAAVSFVMVFTSDKLVAPLELTVLPGTVDTNFPDGTSIVEATALVDLEAGLGYRFFWWLVTDAVALLAVAFLELVRRMLAKGAEPFTEENASRLRWLTQLAIAFAAVDFLRPVVSVVLQDNFGFEGFESVWDFSSLYVAIVLGALLEVWRHGVTLRTDQELTI